MCIYANITLKDIIDNNLHNHKDFYCFAQNSNCTISDVKNNQNLNWKFGNKYLILNKHKYY